MHYPYVIDEPPFPGTHVHSITARNAEGLDAVEIRLRFDERTGPAKALMLFARAAIEVCVRARAPREGR